MDNGKIEEPPLVYIARNPLWLLISVVLSLIFAYWTYDLFKDMNPMGFLLFIQSAMLAFQCLWFFLHPFAGIFADKIEFKATLFHQKTFFFIDMVRIGLDKSGALIIEYTDGETERVSLKGMHKKQIAALLAALPAKK